MLVLAHYVPQGHPTDDRFVDFVEALHLPFRYLISGPSPVDANWRYYSGPTPDPSPTQNYLYGVSQWDPLRPWESRPGAMDGGAWMEPFRFRSGHWAVGTAYSANPNFQTLAQRPADALLV